MFGAFHLTKISGNSGLKLDETQSFGNSFRKFQSTPRGCPFFWKFGNSRNFLFHLAFLPSMISALVPLVVNFAFIKATQQRPVDTTLDAK